MSETVTPDQLARELADLDALDMANRWLARGDGIAVYEAMAFDRSDFGSRQYLSYGSSAAQLEVDEPPKTLPDIGGKINWAYQLVGTYRGDQLEAPTE